jgi:hypothetical protein
MWVFILHPFFFMPLPSPGCETNLCHASLLDVKNLKPPRADLWLKPF